MQGVAIGTRGAAAFEAAALPHYEGLVRRLTLIVGDPDEAKDLAQATYLRAQRAWSRFDGHDARAWLYTIGIRLALNELRRQRRLRAWLPLGSRDEPAVAMEIDPDLWLALRSIDRRWRAALIMSVLEGYSYQEIGELLSVPSGTVASWISRSKSILRARLGEQR